MKCQKLAAAAAPSKPEYFVQLMTALVGVLSHNFARFADN